MPRKKTLDEFLVDLKEKRPDLEYIEGFEKYTANVRVQSNQCHHKWYATPKNLFQGNSQCPICAQKSRNKAHTYTHEEFVELIEGKYKTVEITSKYRGMQSPISYRCKKCNKEWCTTARALVDGRSSSHEKGCGTAYFPMMDEQSIRECFKAGMTLQDIADQYGCTTRTVSTRLADLGLYYRKPRR